MSTNMELITSVTVGSGGASSITLPATGTIPQTYTDLQLVFSLRNAGAGNQEFVKVNFNGSTSNYTLKTLQGDGNTTSSTSYSQPWFGFATGVDATINTFANTQIYIPNYTSSNYKSISVDSVCENNITSNQMIFSANLWSDVSAITSIVLTMQNGANFIQGSTVDLYGISNVTSTTKATGGIVSSDGTYNYHMFPFSGTFTPTQNITADYLVIAGGAGGASFIGGGGGAGGLRSTVGTTGGGGSLESALSLTANTNYTVTIGAGGTGGLGSTPPLAGSNSVFSTITSIGGGRGGYWDGANWTTGGNGGAGGGGGIASLAGGTGTTNQGYAGGAGGPNSGGTSGAGGGGGAGVAGTAGANSAPGAGGNGVAISAFANATQTGVNTYYAGGGGGGGHNFTTPRGAGGLGGGGQGANTDNAVDGTSGVANTGGGGGGAGVNAGQDGGAGGSGLVIIRYAI
jgi:hypothetical protein